MLDNRNVANEFKGKPHEVIVEELDRRGVELEIAIENTLRDYNMGSVVRTANAFGVRHVHVIGRKQWNKRGAMMTDKYLHIHYHHTISDFAENMSKRDKRLYVIDNVEGSVPLAQIDLPKNIVMIFGQEGPGVSNELLDQADKIIAIEQIGSTRSLNVSAAAAVTMYAWVRVHALRI